MFGSHLSVAGGLYNALIEAKSLEMDCVQIFTKNQRQWNARPLDDEQVNLWFEHRKHTGIGVVVSHDSYLINLASGKKETQDKSIASFMDEVERCEKLDIPYLVMHPGAHLGDGEEAGIERIARALDRVHKRLSGYQTITCLEVTAGQGTNLGYRFEHLREIIDRVSQPQRLAVCLDTAHMIAAGYDLTSAAGAKSVLEEIDEVLGLDLVKVVHVNDSKTQRGSRVDRHEHIGLGHVSLEAFKALVSNRHLKNVPKILETPKAENEAGEKWDLVNLRVLKGLSKRKKTKKSAKKS